MSAESAADRVLGVVRGLRKGLSNFVARVMALRTAVRADKFRVAQRLRVALPLTFGNSKGRCGMTLRDYSR